MTRCEKRPGESIYLGENLVLDGDVSDVTSIMCCTWWEPGAPLCYEFFFVMRFSQHSPTRPFHMKCKHLSHAMWISWKKPVLFTMSMHFSCPRIVFSDPIMASFPDFRGLYVLTKVELTIKHTTMTMVEKQSNSHKISGRTVHFGKIWTILTLILD